MGDELLSGANGSNEDVIRPKETNCEAPKVDGCRVEAKSEVRDTFQSLGMGKSTMGLK